MPSRARCSWKAQNPGWYHWLWDEDEQRQLIVDYFPGLLRLYDGLRANVERGDMWCAGVHVYKLLLSIWDCSPAVI